MNDDEVEYYGDPGIASKDATVPKWLKWIYATLPFWGILTFYLYWNGSQGWLDRGYWHQLQTAANTTFPVVNWTEIESQKLHEGNNKNKKIQHEDAETLRH